MFKTNMDTRKESTATGVPIAARSSLLFRPGLFPKRENNETIKVRKIVAMIAVIPNKRRENNAPI